MKNDDSIYHGKDGRLRVYVKETKKTISYPKYLMEKNIGRKLLPNEDVHHIDENPLNNELSNLKILTRSEHVREHVSKYHDTVVICGWCGKEFIWTGECQKNFYSNKRNHGHKADQPFCSRECVGKYGQYMQTQGETLGRNSRRKLSDEQVRYIKNHYKPYDKKYGIRAMAAKFNVDHTVISLIVKGETYKDIL